MLRRTSWAACLVAALVALAGCSNNNTAAPCTPACRDGFVCASGACVPACNPPCGAGQSCVAAGASFTCSGVGTDAGTGTDVPAQSGTDVPPGADVPARTDVPAGTDVPPAMDGGVGDGGTACGAAGQPCCGYRYCNSGTYCQVTVAGGMITSGMCAAYTRGPMECQRPADCTGAQVCQGPVACGDRACFQCGSAPGMAPSGGACSVASDCASGVCALGHCTAPCVADADCASLGTGWACSALAWPVFATSVMGSYATYGTCVRGCARNADCPASQVCVPNLNYLTDHMDFVCHDIPQVPDGDGGRRPADPAGASCATGNTCQSYLCLPAATGSMGTCTAPCVMDADCPPTAPMCGSLTVYRPSGATQATHGCYPR